MEAKSPSESRTILTDLVLPSETNPLNNLFGGELLARMDRAASIAARRHSRRIVVTASVNHVAFNKSIPLGSVVTVEAVVSRAFKSSMEIYIDVWVEDRESGRRTKANEAIYTFVAVDETGTPIQIPALEPETDLEKDRYEAALRRKQLSLVLAGKMKPAEATELKRSQNEIPGRVICLVSTTLIILLAFILIFPLENNKIGASRQCFSLSG